MTTPRMFVTESTGNTGLSPSMRSIKRLTHIALMVCLMMGLALPVTAEQFLGSDVPEGFIPPPLHPKGVRLETQELAPNVYALLSNRPGVDNSGFVVGDRGVL